MTLLEQAVFLINNKEHLQHLVGLGERKCFLLLMEVNENWTLST
jgi:hypothetical protein